MMDKDQNYRVQLEAEFWAPGQWDPDDDNTDVFVHFEDGSRWVASFFSYKNIQTLIEKDRKTGEQLSGAYFWASDMILVEKTSREHIEKVIADLLKEHHFTSVFTQIPPEDIDDEA